MSSRRFLSGGISVGEATGTTIEANNASGTLGSGIEIGELSFRNEILENLTHENGGEGIEVSDSAPNGQGNWRVSLPKMPANATGQKLTVKGKKQLAVETSKWEKFVRAMARVLRPA